MSVYATVARVWPGSTVVCLGGGPSLTPADVDACRGQARVIAINDAYRLAPWADVLYACDDQWWKWHAGVPSFTGLKYSLTLPSNNTWGVQILRNDGPHGLATKPDSLRTGSNGGYQAINLAVHLGAARILLLGYDMARAAGKTHWFGEHPKGAPPPFARMLQAFPTLVAPLAALGVEVVNCTPTTALRTFPRRALRECLAAGAFAEAAC
jgi:hypothetical protein